MFEEGTVRPMITDFMVFLFWIVTAGGALFLCKSLVNEVVALKNKMEYLEILLLKKNVVVKLKEAQAIRMLHTVDVGLIRPMVEDWLLMYNALGRPEATGYDTGTRDEWQALD